MMIFLIFLKTIADCDYHNIEYNNIYPSFVICAPLQQFDTTNSYVIDNKLFDGNGEENITYSSTMFKPAPPDPVVLWPLRDGNYIFVTAWGEEKEDFILKNNFE